MYVCFTYMHTFLNYMCAYIFYVYYMPFLTNFEYMYVCFTYITCLSEPNYMYVYFTYITLHAFFYLFMCMYVLHILYLHAFLYLYICMHVYVHYMSFLTYLSNSHGYCYYGLYTHCVLMMAIFSAEYTKDILLSVIFCTILYQI